MDTYTPLPGWEGGHWMTLYAWARQRRFPQLGEPVPRWFDVAPDARVLAHCHWQPEPRSRPTLLCLHGLEASSTAHYMRGLAEKGCAAGMNVILLNQRNCGGTEHLSAGLYHSGLSADPAAVIRELVDLDGLRAISVAGYSLGGNLALKMAGDFANAHPPELNAVCAVSPTIDLARCVEALERRENGLYAWNFVRHLKARMRRKARQWPGRFAIEHLYGIRTVRMFDERFTAPYHGFRDASDYYHRASALRVIDRVAVPTLILAAENDPVVPPQPFRTPIVTANPHITVILAKHGGHCGFVAAPQNGDDGYWAERQIVEFVKTRMAE